MIKKNNKKEKDYKQNLIKGAHSNLFEYAKDMRKESTKAEKILWEKIRRNALGFKFRRQHPIGNFIPDFYCHTKKLAIELDGAVHYKSDQKRYDKMKNEKLNEEGILILRFPNSLIENNVDTAIAIISKKLKEIN